MRYKTVSASVKNCIPSMLHPYFRSVSRKMREWVMRMDYALDTRTLSQEEFTDHLKNMGINRGSTIYLHSSMDELRRRVPEYDTLKLINLLKELIGEEGTLLAPTFPFRGLQYDYVQWQREYDVKRTPSMVGLFTEAFRRSKGVIRSLHPTHPVAAWGKHSKELLSEHHLGTAFGEKSPIVKMQQYNGLVVGLGVVPKDCFTLYHVAEELHPSTYAMQYGNDAFEMNIICNNGKIPYKVIPLRSDRVRRYDRADRILQSQGILRYYTVKGLKFSVTPVREFLKRSQELIDANIFYKSRRFVDHRRASGVRS